MPEETPLPAPDQPTITDGANDGPVTTRDYTGGQFPSLDGNVEAEVTQRQPEDHEPGFFTRIFTVHTRSHTAGLPAEHEYHRTNLIGVLQDAINRGLHPKGEPEFVGEEPHPWEKDTVNLKYRVPVTPSIVDHEPAVTATPSNELVPDAPADDTSVPAEPAAPDQTPVEPHTL